MSMKPHGTPSVEDLIIKLFTGELDSEVRAAGKSSNSSNYRGRVYRTHSDIIKAIAEATREIGKEHKPSQSRVSVVLDRHLSSDFTYKGKTYRISKIDGRYVLLTPQALREKAKSDLYLLDPFTDSCIFLNNPKGQSTIIGFRVDPDSSDKTEALFTTILGDTLFSSFNNGESILLFLNSNAPSYAIQEQWLKNYFKLNK